MLQKFSPSCSLGKSSEFSHNANHDRVIGHYFSKHIDRRDKGADIGVLVTEVMPSDMDRLGLKDGVWICNYNEFKGLCAVLRESIIRLSTSISSQENKGDKMDMLYTFLTGNSFRMQVEAIVEGFTQMKI